MDDFFDIPDYLKRHKIKGPESIKVGDTFEDGSALMEIVEIKGLVNGRPTYASTFICRLKN